MLSCGRQRGQICFFSFAETQCYFHQLFLLFGEEGLRGANFAPERNVQMVDGRPVVVPPPESQENQKRCIPFSRRWLRLLVSVSSSAKVIGLTYEQSKLETLPPYLSSLLKPCVPFFFIGRSAGLEPTCPTCVTVWYNWKDLGVRHKQ